MTLTHEQKEIRSRGIGSSDIPAIAGLNPWRRPIDVWREKTGRLDSDGDTPATQAGRALEPIIAGWYADERKVCLVPGKTEIRDGWIVATPDYLELRPLRVLDPHPLASPTNGILEVKNVGPRMAFRWPERGVPEYVQAQVLWQTHVWQVKQAHVAVFLGGSEFRIEPIAPEPELLDDLLEIGRVFWTRYVLRDVEPPPDASRSWSDYIAAKWPRSSGPIKLAPPEASAIAARLEDAIAREKAASADRAQAESELKALIGDARGISAPTWCATWTDVEPTEIKAYTRKGYRLFKFNPAWKGSGK